MDPLSPRSSHVTYTLMIPVGDTGSFVKRASESDVHIFIDVVTLSLEKVVDVGESRAELEFAVPGFVPPAAAFAHVSRELAVDVWFVHDDEVVVAAEHDEQEERKGWQREHRNQNTDDEREHSIENDGVSNHGFEQLPSICARMRVRVQAVHLEGDKCEITT